MPRLNFDPHAFPDHTYGDVFLVPYNPVVERLEEIVTKEEWMKLDGLRGIAEQAREGVAQGRDNYDPTIANMQGDALSAYKNVRDYVFELAVKYPDAVKDVSRDEVDITPVDGFGNIPIAVANMNAVTGKRMAEAMSLFGGSAAIPQDKNDGEMKEIADFLHSRDARYMTPITVQMQTRVHELTSLLEKRDIDTAIVTDAQGKFIGVVRLQSGSESTEFGGGIIPSGINLDTPVHSFVRSGGCVTAPEGIGAVEALALMEQNRIHFLPILAPDGTVKGVLTKKFIAAQWRYKPHIDTANGGLAMLATVGALNKNPVDRVKALLDLGAKGIVFDTAHFDQGIQTYRNVEAAAAIIENARLNVLLVAGNVVTRQGTRDIIAAGAKVAKVGIGPGAMCTTRMETGVGRPQFTAIMECADEAAIYGKHVWADGGIQHPRDVALALAAGASQVMIGSLFTPVLESPGPLKHDEGGYYKINYGMASRQAALLRSLGKKADGLRTVFRSIFDHRSEGLSAGKVYRRDENMRSIVDYIHWLLDGLTSSMTYAGARNLDEFRRFATVGVQTGSGYQEGTAKSVS